MFVTNILKYVQSCHLVVIFYSIFSRYINKSHPKYEASEQTTLQKYILGHVRSLYLEAYVKKNMSVFPRIIYLIKLINTLLTHFAKFLFKSHDRFYLLSLLSLYPKLKV